ncbi:ead/Ea22-like family protein [Chitiniphilus purpureus]|uniref:Ead/Ea22-like family protein n=1 Tax=Chitiniphilus purpureus TaxID=2981137 RepID=A0ABY6DK55_9NEIS|nr:ead/Ea22-like family protein [Chitiniphilus sp. CD1]UXY13826.1 ead/Ea22-like family protein [Chitiniphilus sp. CD1]
MMEKKYQADPRLARFGVIVPVEVRETNHDELRRLAQAATPGPWRWEVNAKHKSMQLVGGIPQYDLTVMDFERWGMGGAVIRLRELSEAGMNIMYRVCDRLDWIVPFAGREHHEGWCADIDHADARLIAAANPATVLALLDELDATKRECSALAANSCHRGYGDDYGNHRCEYQDQISALREQLTASQAEVARLREAMERASATLAELNDLPSMRADMDATLAQQSPDDALRAYGERVVGAALDAAADTLVERANDYHHDHGSYDRSTGAWEYPGDGAQYLMELVEQADAIRAIDPATILQEVKP